MTIALRLTPGTRQSGQMTCACGPKRREGMEGEGRERDEEKASGKFGKVVTKGGKVEEVLSPSLKRSNFFFLVYFFQWPYLSLRALGVNCFTHLSHREVMQIMFTEGCVLHSAGVCIEAPA